MFRNTVQTLGVMAAALVAGCVQFSDTLNRAQVSTLPADGGMTVFDQNNAVPMADAPQMHTAAATQSGGMHPNVEYYFSKLCEAERDGMPDKSCDFSINVPYQDEDVALVTAEETGFHGSGGYSFFLLDLKGKPGDALFEGHGVGAKASRKGSKITITYGYEKGDIKESYKKTIDLKKKPRATHICQLFGC